MSADTRLYTLLAPLVADLQLVLLGIEISGSGSRQIVRLYIDQPNFSGEIGIADCEKVSREVAALLDVEDPLPSQYTLEVSSPGVDRPLYGVEQLQHFAGNEVLIKLFTKYENRRKLTGILIGADEKTVQLRFDDHDHELQLAEIRKINIVPDYKVLLAAQKDNTD